MKQNSVELWSLIALMQAGRQAKAAQRQRLMERKRDGNEVILWYFSIHSRATFWLIGNLWFAINFKLKNYIRSSRFIEQS